MSARMSSRRKSRTTAQESLLGHLIDPIDSLSEIIYSILILLTFTLAYRIIRLNGVNQPISAEYVNDLLLAALGATLAWGLIDGVMYVLISVFERGEQHRLLRQLQAAATPQTSTKVLAAELDEVLEPITAESERQKLYSSLVEHLLHGEPQPIRLKREDFVGAVACVCVAIIAVLPSMVPFVLLHDNYALAIRVSNVVSFVMLFIAGYRWGKYTGVNPWKTGLALFGVGILMVLIALPLGG